MHSAWYIEEIRLQIFSELKRPGLARLACTNKFFFDTATDCLWETLFDFRAILCCLPRHYRSRQTQLVADDLARLDLYSSKVKSILIYEPPDPPQITRTYASVQQLPHPFSNVGGKYRCRKGKSWHEVWEQIAKLRPQVYFFPNLQRLHLNNVQQGILRPLIGISGSHLTYVRIQYIHDYRTVNLIWEFLEQLQDTAKLEYLFVRDGMPDLIPLKVIANSPLKHLRVDPRIHAFHHKQNTQQFKLFSLPREILQKSSLEHLTLGLTREWYDDVNWSSNQKYLPALKTLWLNLRTFQPETCDLLCSNRSADSWTCAESSISRIGNSVVPHDCGRKPPTLFVRGLDNPSLELLNIKFPHNITGKMFLDMVQALKESCQLQNLSELVLGFGAWVDTCDGCGPCPQPKVTPQQLKAAICMLLPLPRLKILRLTAGPNFVSDLDMDVWKTIADGLPMLQTLSLGNSDFAYQGTIPRIYERIPLRNAAIFCNLFPYLTDVDMGCVDGSSLEEFPSTNMACSNVTKLRIRLWVYKYDSGSRIKMAPEQVMRNLEAYFPKSDLAAQGYDENDVIFKDRSSRFPYN